MHLASNGPPASPERLATRLPHKARAGTVAGRLQGAPDSVLNANYRGKMPLPLFIMVRIEKTQADCY